jgi:hypothetical protein
MTDTDIARTYIEFWQAHNDHSVDDSDENVWELSVLVQSDPLRALHVIKLISEFTDNKYILCVLGAGELENLLCRGDADSFLEEIISNAQQFPNFEYVLRCVWTSRFQNPAVKNAVDQEITRLGGNV